MKQNRNNPLLLVVAIVLLAIAGLLFWRYSAGEREAQRTSKPVQQEYEEQVQAIMNNPHMPPQAKEAALAAIRARFGAAQMQAPPTARK